MSTTATKASPSIRLALPELLVGGYRSVLILTYSAQLEFYEEVLRRQLATCRNQVILADAIMLAGSVAAAAGGGQLRHLNRTYVAAPIAHSHAAHAKLILLVGPDAGMLLVGSGNLSHSGYAGSGECFAAYPWTPEDQTHLSEFHTAKALADGIAERGMLDSVARSRLARMWSTTDWIHRAAPLGPSLVHHNLDEPLGEQFITAVGDEAVDELVVIAPFYDSHVTALRRLRERLQPAHTKVLVQPKRTSVDAQRLAIALAGCGTSAVHPISAPGEPYLHTKVFLARTATRSICLAGSANCSTVALFDAHPAANLEIGNVVVGEPDAFDHLLADITVEPADDPLTLELAVKDDDSDNVPASWTLTEVCWDPPALHGVVTPALPAEATVHLALGGVVLDDVTVHLTDDAGRQRFEAQLAEGAVAAVEGVVGVSLVVDRADGELEHSAPAVAYQVKVLEAMDARRFDTERLRGAAAMELDDPKLATMLADLERLLITDGRSAWRMASADPAPAEDDEAASFPWEAIDWTLVRAHPRYISYQGLHGLAEGQTSDLAAYLDALSAAIRELIDPEEPQLAAGQLPPGPVDLGEDDDEPTGAAEGEDEETFDENEEFAERRRQSAKTRNLRLVRNYMRRNLRALESPKFRDGVGPGVVVPNAVVLGQMCWWVATRDESTAGELVDERLRLWRCLWGSWDGDPGYLARLDEGDQLLVLDLFAKQDVEAVLLASVYDAHVAMDYDSGQFNRLRHVLRAVLTHPCWQVGAEPLAAAAALVNARSGVATTIDATDIAKSVYDAVARTDLKQVRASLAAIAGRAPAQVQFEDVLVSIDSSRSQTKVTQATIAGAGRLRSDTATRIFAEWSLLEDLNHYRLRCGNIVASYSVKSATGMWYDRATDEELDIGELELEVPDWLKAAEQLVGDAEADATTAATAT